MSKQGANILWALLLALGLLVLPAFGSDADTALEKNGADNKGWKIFPRIGVGIEYGGFIAEDSDFISRLRRRLEIDALQYNHFIVYLEFDEETSFGIPSDKWEFNRIIYHLNLGGLRYDFGEHYLGFMFHHWCFNNYMTKNYSQSNGRVVGSVYFFGLEFLTKTMRLGMKDRGIVFDPEKPFEFLGRFGYFTAVSKTWDKTEGYDLNWLLRAKIRYDIFRYRRLIPYLEAGTELRIGQSARFNPIAEVGVRYHLRDKIDLTPFLQGGHAQEIDSDQSLSPPLRHAARNFLYGGLRVEALVDSSLVPEASGEELQLLPEIHGNASYLNFIKSRFYGWGGNIELYLDVLRYGPWTAFLNTIARLDTKKEDWGPLKFIYHWQYGLTYNWKRFFAEGFVDTRRRLDIVTFSGTKEQSYLAGLRAGTLSMKTGHYDDGISFSGPKFQFLNKWNAQASAAHFFKNQDWQYLWNMAAQVRWDVFRLYCMVPYLQGEINWMSGGGATPDALEYALETGVRFHGGMDMVPFYRFQHLENGRVFRGPPDNQNFVGIRFSF